MKKPARYTSKFKLNVLTQQGTISDICREFKIDRSTYYKWKREADSKNNLRPVVDHEVRVPGKNSYRTTHKLHKNFRSEFIRLVEAGNPVTSVCRKMQINRSTYYKWYKNLQHKNSLESAKRGARVRIDERVTKIVFDIVKTYPKWSLDQIYNYIHQESTVQLISRGAIQKLLTRHNLSTVNKRLAYSYLHMPSITTTVPDITITENSIPVDQQIIRSRGDPSPPVYNASNLVNTIRQASTLYIAAIIASATANAYLLSKVILAISQTPGILNKVGMALASIALFCGIFFFLYSLKYYITIAAVIYKSQKKSGRSGGVFSSIVNKFTSNSQNTDPVALQKQVVETELTEYPFFSVQIPLYNEKKVANRVTAAAAAMDYPNFEVLVCDDSTDETTQLLYDRWAGNDKVKILHRTNRAGFKGAALDNALKYMDPRTEYVVIFDADFVPYPDTLQLFAKYFKVIAENERNNTINPGMADANQVVKDIQAAQYIGKTVAVQGYQWHVLNKSENWITRAVRSEFAGSYLIERSGGQIFGLLKQIAGSVYAINAKVLREVGWGTSITEDFQLTLKLYEQGYKVAYTPYIQAPSECVSTLKRLIRQRQRWAEGHSYNIKKKLVLLLKAPNMSLREKWEVIYLTPYYLQAFVFILGTFCWVIAETVLQVRLPFWSSALGWSLVLTNLFSLPLMNVVGLFLEEGEERDYLGIFSFITLCYVLAPFIGFAALKGFLEKEEGPWFRTPKSGHITDKVNRSDRKPSKIVQYLPWIKPALDTLSSHIGSKFAPTVSPYLAYVTAGNTFSDFQLPNKRNRIIKRGMHTIIVLAFMVTIVANIAQTTIPQAFANPDTFYMSSTTADNQADTGNNKRLQGSILAGAATTTQTLSATNPTMYLITDNLNKRWTKDTRISDVTMPSEISSSGLLGYWKLDESSWNGTTNEVVDSSGNGFHGTSTCNGVGCFKPTTTSSGRYSNAGSFDGTDDYINGSTSTTLNPSVITVSAWINPHAFTQSDAGIVLKGGAYELRLINAGKPAGKVLGSTSCGGSSASGVLTTSAISLDKWYHITWTYDGTTNRIYQNGVLNNTSTETCTIPVNTGRVEIGRQASYFNGRIDDVRVYNRVLSESEIFQLASSIDRRNVQIATHTDGSTVAVWEDSRYSSTSQQNCIQLINRLRIQ